MMILWDAYVVGSFYNTPNNVTIKGVNAMLRSFLAKEEGQGLVEYALILVLIAIVVIGILSLLGGKVSTVFSTINSGLKTP
jgi:pilus assembly protein Flp/PilA